MNDGLRTALFQTGSHNNISYTGYTGYSNTIEGKKIFMALRIVKAIYFEDSNNDFYTILILPMKDLSKYLFRIESSITTENNTFKENSGIITISRENEDFIFGGIKIIESINSINDKEYVSPIITTPLNSPNTYNPYPEGPSSAKPGTIVYDSVDPALRKPATCCKVDSISPDFDGDYSSAIGKAAPAGL